MDNEKLRCVAHPIKESDHIWSDRRQRESNLDSGGKKLPAKAKRKEENNYS